MENEIYRIIDANYNRAREGLRVCEDILRFVILDTKQALKLKSIRHNLSKVISGFKLPKLLFARNTHSDRIKFTFKSTRNKISLSQLLRRNFQRVSEAIRVLEEVCQLIKPESRKKIMNLRFKVYEIEKEVLTK